MQRTVVVQNRYRVTLDVSDVTFSLRTDDMMRGGLVAAPSLAGGARAFTSVVALAHKAKIVNDGVMAAIELLVQQGAPTFPSKAAWLCSLAVALLQDPSTPAALNMAELVTTAVRLGGGQVETSHLPKAFQESLDEALRAGLQRAQDKPISFYTWSKQLEGIFRQDRYLQTKIRDAVEARTVARMIEQRPEWVDVYRRIVRLAARLTAPLVHSDVLNASSDEWSIFPPSRAPETDLIKRLFGAMPVPEGFDLMEELISRLRTGQLDLTPELDAGWYNHEQYALAPLATPERSPEAIKLKMNAEYRAYLADVFKGLMALTRETHIKQLEIAGVGAGYSERLWVSPWLTTEPLIEHYRRRANAYEHVRSILVDTFGSDVLSQTFGLREHGVTPLDVLAELDMMIGLYRGAAAASASEIGWNGFEGREREAASFLQWRQSTDSDLAIDTRMMVPVFYDERREKTKVWCLLGYEERGAAISFDRSPAVVSVESLPLPPEALQPRTGRSLREILADREARKNPPLAPPPPPVAFSGELVTVLAPVVREVYVDRLLNRDEFRALCDRHAHPDAIVAALQQPGGIS